MDSKLRHQDGQQLFAVEILLQERHHLVIPREPQAGDVVQPYEVAVPNLVITVEIRLQLPIQRHQQFSERNACDTNTELGHQIFTKSSALIRGHSWPCLAAPSRLSSSINVIHSPNTFEMFPG